MLVSYTLWSLFKHDFDRDGGGGGGRGTQSIWEVEHFPVSRPGYGPMEHVQLQNINSISESMNKNFR